MLQVLQGVTRKPRPDGLVTTVTPVTYILSRVCVVSSGVPYVPERGLGDALTGWRVLRPILRLSQRWMYGEYMDELMELKTLAKKLASAIGAVTSASDSWNRNGSEASMKWWERKRTELYDTESELANLLKTRIADRAAE